MKAFALTDLPPHLHAQIIQQLNPESSRKNAIVERVTGDGTLGPRKVEKRHTAKFLVRITSFRRRLLDEDNLAEKYHVDCCRYAGLIPSDAPGCAKIETAQKKVGMKEDEYTLIEIDNL